MNDTNRIMGLIERKVDMARTTPERHASLRSAAENLSRKNVDQAVCELMNEAMGRLVDLSYQEDAGGLCNIDTVTGRLLVPLPWGSNGYRKWGLRVQEANILRLILFGWQFGSESEPHSLFLYDASRRAWFVNLAKFPKLSVAKGWLRAHPVTIPLYRAARANVAT